MEFHILIGIAGHLSLFRDSTIIVRTPTLGTRGRERALLCYAIQTVISVEHISY